MRRAGPAARSRRPARPTRRASSCRGRRAAPAARAGKPSRVRLRSDRANSSSSAWRTLFAQGAAHERAVAAGSPPVDDLGEHRLVELDEGRPGREQGLDLLAEHAHHVVGQFLPRLVGPVGDAFEPHRPGQEIRSRQGDLHRPVGQRAGPPRARARPAGERGRGRAARRRPGGGPDSAGTSRARSSRANSSGCST